jgi:signal transduction histidine kinase
MSYQSIKRVLGETSLERKCRFLFGGMLLVLITASFWWYGRQTEQLVNQRNPIMGRLLVDQSMLEVHWKELETDEEFRVDVLKDLTANLGKEDYSSGYIKADRAGQPLVVLSRMGRDVVKAPGAERPTQPLDAFERDMLAKLLKEESRETAASDDAEPVDRFAAGQTEYQYYQPIYAESQTCVTCHNALGWTTFLGGTPLNEGDLMAIAKVTISNKPTQTALNWNRAILLSTAIVTVFLAMIASYVIVRYVIVKPLRHLRDVSDSISHGNIALRAEIHTGDEFESLAVAFNRMLRHLVAVQEELRQVNADLDAKVDELAQVNMRLYELNTIKSDFLATMSHELRTPLNSILGFSDVLGSIDSLGDKQKRYVENIRSSGKMLLEMINDILDLAKMESGKMDTRVGEFQIGQVVRAQCDMARPLTERKNIDLEIAVPDHLPPVRQDQARVQQILNNLLSNAIKFTPEGGRIAVSAGRDGDDRLTLQVSDTGVGIAQEDQQVIFEKFRQGRTAVPTGDAMTREYSGTGLGLSIVKELCKLLGGEVAVQSELGRGSTFTVRLPWTLEEQPRLDSAMVEGFEEFTKPRLEMRRERLADLTGERAK